MTKLTYPEFCSRMYDFNATHNHQKEQIHGVIVFTPDSFTQEYSLESRSYKVTSDNKAWIPGMAGYSIFGSSLDGTDIGVRLESYMRAEKGGPDGWRVEYCYMLDN